MGRNARRAEGIMNRSVAAAFWARSDGVPYTLCLLRRWRDMPRRKPVWRYVFRTASRRRASHAAALGSQNQSISGVRHSGVVIQTARGILGAMLR